MLPTSSSESKLVRFSLIAFFVLLVGYALYEGWGLISGPVITVPEEILTVSEPYALIKGRAERITELRLNGAIVPVTESGEFEQPYLLAPGSNRLILEARDARGRTDMREIVIAYTPKNQPVFPTFTTPTSSTATTTEEMDQ